MTRVRPTCVPVDWDNDYEEEEIDSRKNLEPAYTIPSQLTLPLGGDSGKLVEIRAWEHIVSHATIRDFQIVNLSDGHSTVPTNDHPSSDEEYSNSKPQRLPP